MRCVSSNASNSLPSTRLIKCLKSIDAFCCGASARLCATSAAPSPLPPSGLLPAAAIRSSISLRSLRYSTILPIVSGPASPSVVAPNNPWNSLTALIVPLPYLPSTPLGSMPISVKNCCSSSIAAVSSASLARPPFPELANASNELDVDPSPGSTLASWSPLSALTSAAAGGGAVFCAAALSPAPLSAAGVVLNTVEISGSTVSSLCLSKF